MNYERIGPIDVIFGERESRAPFSTVLLLRDGGDAVLIDCGAGHPAFSSVSREYRVQEIFLTHYHLDHIWGVYLFPQAHKWINPYDYRKLTSWHELAKASGVYAAEGERGGAAWVAAQQEAAESPPPERDTAHAWGRVFGAVDRVYPYQQELMLAGIRAVMLHAPGHCEGYCCPYFPDHGVLHVGDFDLTSFGPWYCNADSDIDHFIQSARMTLEVDADYYVTSHQKGVVTRIEYRERLERYLEVIDRRDEKLRQAVKRGCSPQELLRQEVFYYAKNLAANPGLLRYQAIGIAKHLTRMVRRGEPWGDYVEHFFAAAGLDRRYLDVFSVPQAADQIGADALRSHESEGNTKMNQ
jgi:hydroxyacylglutathione hydrolase